MIGGRDKLKAVTLQAEAFDINLHATKDGLGLKALQDRFSMWLRGLEHPARLITWQMPADLRPRIHDVNAKMRHVRDGFHKQLLGESRRFYEELQDGGNYQRAVCSLLLWADAADNEKSLRSAVAGTLNIPIWQSPLPPLFDGTYLLAAPNKRIQHWYLKPRGKPAGRSLFAVMLSYHFYPTTINFFKPLAALLRKPYPMALAFDISKTYERNNAISKIEGVVGATRAHLATSTAQDSKSMKKYGDLHLALQQLNEGDRLHEVQIAIALAAPDTASLQKAIDDVMATCKPYFLLRPCPGEQLSEAVKFFTTTGSRDIALEQTTWQMVSREAALFFAPLGYRKLMGLLGTLRGQSADGSYPFFHNSWGREKKATHELWVGQTGSGKTFGLNLYLTRSFVEESVPFDLLEPMGHGKILADALQLDWYVPSPRQTRINPLDVMYPDMPEQVNHVIRLFETLLGRQFAGNQLGNHQKSVLGQAAQRLYRAYTALDTVRPDNAPIVDDLLNILSSIGDRSQIRKIAKDLADEIAGLCSGQAPFAAFVNARTNIDLSYRGRSRPRVFSFHDMTGASEELTALAYTQVLTAIRRDSLANEQPRIIAVDEIYRLMRHPSLLDFLIEAVKTFRTRRKKVISIDQNMSIFLEGKARLLFENSPIKNIFNQKDGIHLFRDDPAFSHYTDNHFRIISGLRRGFSLLEIADMGLFYLHHLPSAAEFQRFGKT